MILFIDDEPRYVEPFVDELQLAGYATEIRNGVYDGVAELARCKDQVKLVILDIMMPPGELLAGVDTQKGRTTGMVLYDRLRGDYPKLPFIVLTNVSRPELDVRFAHEPGCRLLRKYEFLPSELLGEVRALIGEPPAQGVAPAAVDMEEG